MMCDVCKVDSIGLYAEVLGDKKLQMFSQRGSVSSHEGVWQQQSVCVCVCVCQHKNLKINPIDFSNAHSWSYGGRLIQNSQNTIFIYALCCCG